MTIIILSNYNNYYNRIVKKFDNLEEYENFVIFSQDNVNFIPNDGITTTQILGSNVNNYDGSGDYLLVADSTGNINSRWFILKSIRDRAGQYTLTLRRDLIADYYNQVIDSPIYIEKATLSEDNPLIFNNEGITVNQILTDQILLKDQTQCGWFVGYYAKNSDAISGTVVVNNLDAEVFETITTPIEEWEYAKYNSNSPFVGELTSAKFYVFSIDGWRGYRDTADTINHTAGRTSASSDTTLETANTTATSWFNTIEHYGAGNLTTQIKPYFKYNTSRESDSFFKYNGKILKEVVGDTIKYYEIKISPTSPINSDMRVPATGGLFLRLSELSQTAGYEGTPNKGSFGLDVTASRYILTYTERKDLSTRYNIPANNKLTTTDQPYNIFAIPYGDIKIKYFENSQLKELVMSKELGKQTIASILGSHGNEGAGKRVYDAQLIGYCPVNYLITDINEITISDDLQASFIVTGPENNELKLGAIFNVPNSSFSLNIPVENIVLNNKKIRSICEFYRLIAPDQSNYFDIDVAKNDGIYNINIDIDLKPFNCYIHANPDFKGLYGRDFNTARGLIYGNNLSLSRTLNAFTEYQIQNSQFQNIFDRQVQNLEVKQNVQRLHDVVGGITGTVAGAVGGAMVGGVGGAIAGGVVSSAGAFGDAIINEKLRNEQLDYTKSMFELNLKNIQAQPNTLSRVTALTQNNTLFIALEFYTCTEEEKRAVANKIAWTGMTVNNVGRIADYIQNVWSYNDIISRGFVKGKLIRLIGDFDKDYNIANEIGIELNKGVYF